MPYREDPTTDRLGPPFGGRRLHLKLAAPCSADWEAMIGDDHVRFCAGCKKNVYNLSGMSSAQAQALLEEREGNLCTRFYRRADGTIMTSDCPVGVERRRPKRGLLLAGGVAMAAAAAAAALPDPPDPPTREPTTLRLVVPSYEMGVTAPESIRWR